MSATIFPATAPYLTSATQGHREEQVRGSDWLLALSVLASTASQLRVGGAPVGPGELGLALWLCIVFARSFFAGVSAWTPAASKLLIFWTVFLVSMSIGTMTGYLIGDAHDPVWFRHDMIAYIFMAILSFCMMNEFSSPVHARRVGWILVSLSALSFAAQISLGVLAPKMGDIDLWEWDRLRGFSDNSNQLALVCTIVGLLTLNLVETTTSVSARIWGLLCIVASIVAGRMSKSDAFLLVMLVAAPTFIILKLRSSLLASRQTLSLGAASSSLILVMAPVMLVFMIAFGGTVATQITRGVAEMTRGGGKADTQESTKLRFELWEQAIRRGVDAWLLGRGPGPHLDIPPSIISGRQGSGEPDNMVHPKLGFWPNFEAHNTFLDLFGQGGLPSVLDICWLSGTIMLGALRRRLDAQTTFYAGMAVYALFHFVVRHPILWFAVVMSLVCVFNSDTPDDAPRDNRARSGGAFTNTDELRGVR